MLRRAIPNDGIIGVKIGVGEDVAESSDGSPRNLWSLDGQLSRQLLDRLPDDFETARDSVDAQLVRAEELEVQAGDVGLDRLAGLDDVLQ